MVIFNSSARQLGVGEPFLALAADVLTGESRLPGVALDHVHGARYAVAGEVAARIGSLSKRSRRTVYVPGAA